MSSRSRSPKRCEPSTAFWAAKSSATEHCHEQSPFAVAHSQVVLELHKALTSEHIAQVTMQSSDSVGQLFQEVAQILGRTVCSFDIVFENRCLSRSRAMNPYAFPPGSLEAFQGLWYGEVAGLVEIRGKSIVDLQYTKESLSFQVGDDGICHAGPGAIGWDGGLCGDIEGVVSTNGARIDWEEWGDTWTRVGPGRAKSSSQSLADVGLNHHALIQLFLRADYSLLTGSADATVKIWSLASGMCTSTLIGHKDEVVSVAFSADGRMAVTGSRDCLAKVWCTKSGTCLVTFYEHDNPIDSVACSPRGSSVVTASEDGIVKLWDAKTAECSWTFHLAGTCSRSAVFSPDGLFVLTHSNKVVQKWCVQSGECALSFSNFGGGGIFNCVVYSPDGSLIATGSEGDGIPKVWNADSGKNEIRLLGHRRHASVGAVAFSPDSKHIVAECGYHLVVWSLPAGIYEFAIDMPVDREEMSWGVPLIFSPDSRYILSCDRGSLCFWCVENGEQVLKLDGHTDFVNSVAVFCC